MADEVPRAESKASEPAHDFEDSYVSSTPPWDIGRPQPAFVRLAASGGLAGRVLDAGCGTGEHALMAASQGHDAVGIDFASTAIDLARAKATDRGVQVRFLLADALHLVELGEQFDTVLDCGLFHVFADDDRARYVQNISSVVVPGGRYHMLCFSELQPGDWGPRRVSRDEIRASFADGWLIESIEAAVIDLTWDQAGVRAWQVAAART
jgi:cyclopropane fatty-acyl-phospholipid synthase-like methyltransferase